MFFKLAQKTWTIVMPTGIEKLCRSRVIKPPMGHSLVRGLYSHKNTHFKS